MGSVSQIGWEWYSRLAGRVPVTLITHVRNRAALESAGAPLPGSRIIFVDTEWLAGPLYRTAVRLFPKSQHAVFLLSSLDFFVYDVVAFSRARKNHERGKWDIVHVATPVSPLASTNFHRLALPLVVGPWNGGLSSPPNFPEIMKQDSSWIYPIRNLGRIADILLGGSRNASVILSANRTTREGLPKKAHSRCIEMLENGVDLNRFQVSEWPYTPGEKRPLRVLFVGRLVPFKGVSLLLEAVARFCRESAIEVRIVGDGPMAEEWKRLASTLGVSGLVNFTGETSLAEVPSHMAWAHLFCLPSVRESGGAVLLEAMASARPVTAVAYGGPAELVDEQVGHAIPPSGSSAVVDELVEVFRSVNWDPESWRQRGLEGRRRAEALFSWNAKIDQAVNLYARLRTRRKHSPA